MININFTQMQTPSSKELIKLNTSRKEDFVKKLRKLNRIKNGKGSLTFTNNNSSKNFTKFSFVNQEGTIYNDWVEFLYMNVSEDISD